MSRTRNRMTAYVTGGLVTLLVLLFEASTRPGSMMPVIGELAGALEAVAYDFRLRSLTPESATARHPIVIVDLDEDSLQRIGQFPWPRSTTASLLEALLAAEPAVIAFDMVFAEPETNPVTRILDATELSPEATAELQARADAVSGDQLLARLIAGAQGTDVVFSSFLGGSGPSRGAAPRGVVTLPAEQVGRTTLFRFRSWTSVIAEIAGNAGIGHIITLPDSLDGVIRRAPLLVDVQGELVPALALEAARRYLFLDQLALDMVAHGNLYSPRALLLGDKVSIPVDRHGRVLLPFRGPTGTFPYLAAADVIEDRLSEQARQSLQGAIVLIGTSAIGLADLRSTPLDRVYPGVEVHATLIDGLLEAAAQVHDGRGPPAFPREPELKWELTLAGLALAGLLFTMVMSLLNAIVLSACALLLAGLWIAICALAWTRYGLDLPMTSPLLLITGVAVSQLALGFLLESRRRRELRGMFDHYVPPAHIERMIERGASISLEGESRVMTVLFGDIKGFTALSEGRSAQELKAILNELFTPITEVVLQHQGTIDKYVGDMIMAFWNAPLVDASHRQHAIDAALAFSPALDRINASLAARGLPEVDMGVGINTGLMNVGDMGSDFRLAYTVLGDAVNLGSRIEGLTRHYGVRVLVGEQTRDEAGEFLFRFIDRVAVHGRQQLVRLYEPVCRVDEATPELERQLLRYHGAYWMYAEKDWDRAAAAFDALLAEEPDRVLYRIYRQRIDLLRQQDLGPEWNGEIRHAGK